MPVRIYRFADIRDKVAYICRDSWDLDEQLWKLHEWVKRNKGKLKGDHFVADIGYAMRKDATGGGHALTKKEMLDYVEFGMDIYFSQYPL
jgi:hypothetical protein